jgi:hypothetical protein
VPILFILLLWTQSPASCADAADCRLQSVEAATRGEFELAHDYAWRAVQKGKKNDQDLMLVLARAQSLSGRPGDALVMLGRIADLGGAPDVASDPDFARVRALPGWPELAARLTGAPAPPPSAPSAAAAPRASADPPAPASSAPPAPAVPAPSTPGAPAASPAPASSPSPETLSFTAPNLDPFAMAHDAVSRRFVIGDRRAHRLLIVDEVSKNTVNYVSASSAGFYDELTAFSIDARRGDLWVTSARGSGDEAASVVHKLQLVSGRTLLEARAAEKSGPVRFVGVTATPDGTVYALDAVGNRLFRAQPGSRTFNEVMRFDSGIGVAVAAADDRTLYVGGAKGLLRVDPVAKTTAAVRTPEQLTGFESLAWRSGSLIGVERVADSYLVVRINLDPAGTRAQPRQILAASPRATVGTLAGDGFYYLSDLDTIRRLPIK